MATIRPRVVTAADVEPGLMLGEPKGAEDTYLAKIIKYIPAEIVAAYQMGAGIILGLTQTAARDTTHWIWVAFLFVLSPFWTAFATRETGKPIAWFQTVITPFAFIVWIFALGGPFELTTWYQQLYGSLVLIAVTLVIPILEKVFVR